mgnify:FL=1
MKKTYKLFYLNKLKRKIIFLIILILLNYIFFYLYNLFAITNRYQKVYILNQDIKEGQNIKDEYFDIEYVKNNNFHFNNKNEEYVFKCDLKKGQILNDTLVINKENYKVKKEYINIKLNENLNYNIKKGDIVNIYYTSKDKSKLILENIEIINSYNKEGIESNKNITQILIGIKSDDVSIINSLKEGGLFDISIVKK